MISAHDITELTLNNTHFAFLREKNEHLYHIFVPKKGYLLVNL